MKQLTIKIVTSKVFFLKLIFYLFLTPNVIQAKELGEQQVRAAVETWVRYVTADARSDAMIERMEPYMVEGKTYAYIAHLSGGGFCICGADDLVLPVYFYSPKGEYNSENPDYQDILFEIRTRLKYFSESIKKGDVHVLEYQQRLSERTLFWNNLITGNNPIKFGQEKSVLAEPDSMSLPLTCTWHQDSPYNDMCPELTPNADERTAVGCVATALSQIMYYWKWPNTGFGSRNVNYNYFWRSNWDQEQLSSDPNIPDILTTAEWSNRLKWTSANGGMLQMNGYWDESVYIDAKEINSSNDAYLSALQNLYNRLNQATTTCYADFGATSYQWNLMQNSHSDPVDAGDAAVATLCYQVAVAMNMNFGIINSSTFLYTPDNENIDHSLVTYFLYDRDISIGDRNPYGQDYTAEQIIKDIQWLRPVGFSGTGLFGSHTWVLYGYYKGTDQYTQFKMNMGWPNAANNGWYSLDDVPEYLNDDQQYLYNIAPRDVVKFVGNTITGDGSPSEPYKNIEEAVTNVSNGTTLIFKAGSDNLFSEPLTITKPLTLKGRDVNIRKQ